MTTKHQRRQFPRYHFGPAVLGEVCLRDTGSKYRIWMWDISKGGISFKSSVPLEVGSVMDVHVKGQGTSRAHCLPVRTIHATQEPDGCWRVGCQFTGQLSGEIIEELL